jgi:hypothetical protein
MSYGSGLVLINHLVVAANTASFTFAGPINGNNDRFYKMFFNILNTGAAGQFGMQLNGANNGTSIQFTFSQTTNGQSVAQVFEIANINGGGEHATGEWTFYPPTGAGTRRGYGNMATNFGGTVQNQYYNHQWVESVTNITSLVVNSIGGSQIGAGSEFWLYRLG